MTLKESFLEFLHHGKIYSKKQIISYLVYSIYNIASNLNQEAPSQIESA